MEYKFTNEERERLKKALDKGTGDSIRAGERIEDEKVFEILKKNGVEVPTEQTESAGLSEADHEAALKDKWVRILEILEEDR